MAKKEIKKTDESNRIALFEGDEIRRVEFDGNWFYAVEDVVQVLTDSTDVKQYVKKLRQRDEELSANWGTICTPLPLTARDGKRRSVNCTDNEGVLRLVQSIPSKKAEPFKRWLARVGKERLEEIEQPAKAIERAKNYYHAKGYDEKWIETRSLGVDTRHKFTDTLKEHGITKGYEYAVLTNELYASSFGLDTKEYKEHKGLNNKDSLRDNMRQLELISVMFSEATSTELINETGAKGFVETKKAIHLAGNITKEAIAKLEKASGKKVVTHDNARELDTPEIRQELAQQSLPKKKEDKEPLSDLNKKLKKGLEFNPNKEKRVSALSLASIKKRKANKKKNKK